MLFSLGRLLATPGALETLTRAGIGPATLLNRHQNGDWGELDPEDVRENQLSLRCGFRLLSAYTVDDQKLWIITEADRSATTILLPEEY